MALLCKLIIIFIVLQGVFGQEESTATADNETTESEEATDSPSVPPHISTEPQTFLVQSGQRVVLPCKITNLQEAGAVVVWKRGEKWLTNGVVTFKGNPSISLDKETYTLTIKRAHDRDAGNYSCIASAGSDNEVKVQHLVIIVYPPSVDIQPNDSPLDAIKDAPFALTCTANGFPLPSIDWILVNTNGERKELHHFKNVSRIEVSSMSRADVGTYYCVANNGVGEPVNDSVVVHIRYKPELLGSTSVFLSKIGGEAKLDCSFSAYPIEGYQFRWHRILSSADENAEADASAKEEIQNDARHTIDTQAKDTTISSTLTIHNVEDSDFTKYICVAENDRGEEQHEIELSGLAYPMALQSTDKRGGVRWSVKSISPIKEYRIIYREINETHEGEAQNLTILEDGKDIPSDAGSEVKIYEKTYVFENLRPSRNYSLVMMAQNEYGWSREIPHKFLREDDRSSHASGLNGRGSIFKSHQPLFFSVSVVIFAWICRH